MACRRSGVRAPVAPPTSCILGRPDTGRPMSFPGSTGPQEALHVTRSSTGPSVTLNNGVVMPAIGFGVFQVPPETTAAVVASALGAGYRSIDTAAIYDNEVGTGDGIRASGLAREDVFLTTKVWNDQQG